MSEISSLQQAWIQTLAVWEHGFNGIDIQRLTIALIVLLTAFFLRRFVARLFLRFVGGVLHYLGPSAEQSAASVLGPPAQLLSMVVGLLIITDVVVTSTRLSEVGHDLVRTLVVIALFWALNRAIVPSFRALLRRTSLFNHSMMDVAIAGSRIIVVVLGAAMTLEIWGIRVVPVLAGFGLVGAAVALGAQDLFKNLIGGIFIIAERRFQIGDWIAATGVCEGTVEKIGLRTTTIRRFDLSPVYVPNSQLADNPVTNYQQMTYRRISWMVGLTYDTTIEQLRQVRDGIESHLKSDSSFVQPPDAPLFVRIDSFGESSINVMVYCFTRTTDWSEWLRIKENLVYTITSIVDQAGSGFAFPSQSVYLESVPKGVELFPATPVPPGAGADKPAPPERA